MDLVVGFRFKVPCRFFPGKLLQAMLAHGKQPDPLDCATPGVDGIASILFLALEPAVVEPNQFFVESMAVTLGGGGHFRENPGGLTVIQIPASSRHLLQQHRPDVPRRWRQHAPVVVQKQREYTFVAPCSAANRDRP